MLTEEMKKSINELDFWREITQYYYRKKYISEKQIIRLNEFLSIPEVISLWDESWENEVSQEEILQEKIGPDGVSQGNLSKQEAFQRLEESVSSYCKVYHERTEDEERFQQWVRRYAVNQEKYMDDFFERGKVHLILYHVCENKYEKARALMEKQVKYKRYGEMTTVKGELHASSPVDELVTSNTSVGEILKQPPKRLKNKVEYDYDETGRLIMKKRYEEAPAIHSTTMYFYSQNYVFAIDYFLDKVGGIDIQKYRDELIVEVESSCSTLDPNEVREVRLETYYYNEEMILEMCWRESYIFPGAILSEGMLLRNRYIFGADEQGHLVTYTNEGYWGDEKSDGHFLRYWTEVKGIPSQWNGKPMVWTISENISDKTGKDSGRWRRPNYFRN